MKSELKISFLNDSPDNWMADHVKKFIKESGQNHSIRIAHSAEEIQSGDILFILSFYKLVPSEFLKLNKYNVVVHASKLPGGKGWSPATWQILEGKNRIPLTMFEAIDKVDAGDIYFQEDLELNGTELIKQWQNKMAEKIMEMVKKFIEQYPRVSGKRQIGNQSYYKRRAPEDSEIDVNKTIAEQFNKLRVVDNEKYPAFFTFKGKRFVLKISEEN